MALPSLLMATEVVGTRRRLREPVTPPYALSVRSQPMPVATDVTLTSSMVSSFASLDRVMIFASLLSGLALGKRPPSS